MLKLFFILLSLISTSCISKSLTNEDRVDSSSLAQKANTDTPLLCTNEVARLMNGVQMLPKTNQQGKVFGFLLTDMKPGHLFEKMGLLKEDIILSINGVTLDSPQGLMDGFMALKKVDVYTFLIQRSGKDFSIKKNCPN